MTVSSGPYSGQYRNLATLWDRVAALAKTSRRTFTRRIGQLRSELDLSVDAHLVLTEGQLLGLLQPADTRANFETFVARLADHCRHFTARPLASATTTDDASAFDNEEAYAKYQNNQTIIYFECLVDSGHGRYGKPFSRLDSQGCPICGDERGREKRSLSPEVIRKRVASHHLGLEIVGGLELVKNNTSFITLQRRECGHTFQCAVQDLTAPRRLRACPDCHPHAGEAITAITATYLLTGDKDPSPYHDMQRSLSRADDPTDQRMLRLDMFFENILPGGSIIVEHHGHHHFVATRYGGRSERDADRALKLQQERDRWLRGGR